MRELTRLVYSLLLAAGFAVLLYLYIFSWRDTPNLARLLGF